MILQYILLTSLLISPLDQDKLVRTKIDNGISFGLPSNMHAMTDVEIASKYVSYRDALGFYTDEDRMADFIINHSATPWSPNDIEMLKDVYKSSIYNLYTEVDMIREEIREVHGRKFIIYEFISSVSEENSMVQKADIVAYNFVGYTIVKNKVYVFTFSCPKRLQPKWQNTAQAMMDSIKIK